MSGRAPITAVAFATVVCLGLPGVAAAQEQAPPAPVELWKTYPLDPTGRQSDGEQGAAQPGASADADASVVPPPGAASSSRPREAQPQEPAARDEGGASTAAVLLIVAGLLVLLAVLGAAVRSRAPVVDPRRLAARVRAPGRELTRSGRRPRDPLRRIATEARSVAATARRVSRSVVDRLPEASAGTARLVRSLAAASVRPLRQPARPGRLELATAGPPPPSPHSDAVTDRLVAADAADGGHDEQLVTEPAEPTPDAAVARERNDARRVQTPKEPVPDEELVTLKAKAHVGGRARAGAAPKETQDDQDDVEILKQKAGRPKRATTRTKSQPKAKPAKRTREQPAERGREGRGAVLADAAAEKTTTPPREPAGEPAVAEPAESAVEPAEPTAVEPAAAEPAAAESAAAAEPAAAEPAEPTAVEPVEPAVAEPAEPTAAEPAVEPAEPTAIEPAAAEPAKPTAVEPAEPVEPAAVAPATPQVAAAECEIVWWRGFSTSQFLAVCGDDLVASSPFFAASDSEQPRKTSEAVRAHEALVETLERDGWSVAERGRDWFRLRMRHTAPPKTVGPVETANWRQRDERERHGNRSTV